MSVYSETNSVVSNASHSAGGAAAAAPALSASVAASVGFHKPKPPPSCGSCLVRVLSASGAFSETGKWARVCVSVSGSSRSTAYRRHPSFRKKQPISWKEELNFKVAHPADQVSVVVIMQTRSKPGNSSPAAGSDSDVGSSPVPTGGGGGGGDFGGSSPPVGGWTLHDEPEDAAAMVLQAIAPSRRGAQEDETPLRPGELIIGKVSVSLTNLSDGHATTKWFQLKPVFRNSADREMCNGAVIHLGLKLDLDTSLVKITSDSSSISGVPSQLARQQGMEEESQRELRLLEQLGPPRLVEYLMYMSADPVMCCATPGSSREMKPRILQTYPNPANSAEEMNKRPPPPENLELFCFPGGFHPAATAMPPRSFSFQLSSHDSILIGVCLVYWRRVEFPAHQNPHDEGEDSSGTGVIAFHPHRRSDASGMHHLPRLPEEGSMSPLAENDEGNQSIGGSAAGATGRSESFNGDNSRGPQRSLSIQTDISDEDPLPPPSHHRRANSLSVSNSSSPQLDASNGRSVRRAASVPKMDLSSLTQDLLQHRSHGPIVQWVPHAVCLLSRYPFVPQFREILAELYTRFIKVKLDRAEAKKRKRSDSGQEVPQAAALAAINGLSEDELDDIIFDDIGRCIEQYVQQLCLEIPMPEAGRTPVEMWIGMHPFTFRLPPAHHDFPHLEFSAFELFTVLDLSTVLETIRCLLTEMKIIFVSRSYSLLHKVSSTLMALLFPFEWPHVYVPVLPRAVAQVLDAPVPFVVGVHEDDFGNLDRFRECNGYAIINIDRSDIDCSMPPVPFSRKSTRILSRAISRLTKPHVYSADDVHVAENYAAAAAMDGTSDVPATPQSAGGVVEDLASAAVASPQAEPAAAAPNSAPSGGWVGQGTLHEPSSPGLLSSTSRSPRTSILSSRRARGLAEKRPSLNSSNNSPYFSFRKLQPQTPKSQFGPAPGERRGSGSSGGRRNLLATRVGSRRSRRRSSSVTSGAVARAAAAGVSSVHEAGEAFLKAQDAQRQRAAQSKLSSRHRDRQIRYAFFEFMSSLLHSYRDYMFFVGGAAPMFNTPEFLAQTEDNLPLLSKLLATQMFNDFLHKHVVYPSYLDDLQEYLHHDLDADKHMISASPRSINQAFRPFMLPLPERFSASWWSQLRKDAATAPSVLSRVASSIKAASSDAVEDSEADVGKISTDHLLLAAFFGSPRVYLLPSVEIEEEDDAADEDMLREAEEEKGSAIGSEAGGSRKSSRRSFGSLRIDTKLNKRASGSFVFKDIASAAVASKKITKRHRRRMTSTALISKSDLEMSKPVDQTRMHRVLDALLGHASGGGGGGAFRPSRSEVGLSDVSAVGELLSLAVWRDSFCSSLEGYLNGSKSGFEHRRVPEDAFSSLTLLFKIALEEAHSEFDFACGRRLLRMADHIYCGEPNRVFLASQIRGQKLWSLRAFWDFCFSSDMKEHQRNQFNVDENGAPFTVEEEPDEDREFPEFDDNAREMLAFSTLSNVMWAQLSLGVQLKFVQQFLTEKAESLPKPMPAERIATLMQLADNISRSIQQVAAPGGARK